VRAQVGNVRCELWIVDDETATARVSRLLEDAPLYIADGHHRLAAGRGIAALERTRGRASRGAVRSVALFVAASEASSGLSPIHRTLRVEAAALRSALQTAERSFERREITDPLRVREALAEETGAFAFALFVPREGAFVFSLREGLAPRDLPGVAEATPLLDAVLAEEVVLGGMFELSKEQRRAHVRYLTDDEAEARLADTDELLLLLRAPSLVRVLELSDEGTLLPEKSTSFSPKPPTGLVMAALFAGADGDDDPRDGGR
jgi:uncharacterized protein (DUF1015 family)